MVGTRQELKEATCTQFSHEKAGVFLEESPAGKFEQKFTAAWLPPKKTKTPLTWSGGRM